MQTKRRPDPKKIVWSEYASDREKKKEGGLFRVTEKRRAHQRRGRKGGARHFLQGERGGGKGREKRGRNFALEENFFP